MVEADEGTCKEKKEELIKIAKTIKCGILIDEEASGTFVFLAPRGAGNPLGQYKSEHVWMKQIKLS